MGDFNVQDLATAAWAYATLGIENKPLMTAILSEAVQNVLTICLLIGKPMYKLVNPEFTVSLHQL